MVLANKNKNNVCMPLFYVIVIFDQSLIAFWYYKYQSLKPKLLFCFISQGLNIAESFLWEEGDGGGVGKLRVELGKFILKISTFSSKTVPKYWNHN